MSDAPAAAAALERAFRDERAAVLATLTRHLGGDLGAAEDALQDALADAAREWPRSGAPARPGAWLTVAARRRALDRLRREKAQAGRAAALEHLVRLDQEHPDDPDAPAMLDRIRRWRDGYLRWGRDTMGFALYLHRVPASGGPDRQVLRGETASDAP